MPVKGRAVDTELRRRRRHHVSAGEHEPGGVELPPSGGARNGVEQAPRGAGLRGAVAGQTLGNLSKLSDLDAFLVESGDFRSRRPDVLACVSVFGSTVE